MLLAQASYPNPTDPYAEGWGLLLFCGGIVIIAFVIVAIIALVGRLLDWWWWRNRH